MQVPLPLFSIPFHFQHGPVLVVTTEGKHLNLGIQITCLEADSAVVLIGTDHTDEGVEIWGGCVVYLVVIRMTWQLDRGTMERMNATNDFITPTTSMNQVPSCTTTSTSMDHDNHHQHKS